MRLIESLKRKKFILFNIFFTLYIGINLIGGERGLISYYDKKRIYEELEVKDKVLTRELEDLEHKNSLLTEDIDLDFIEILIREKFLFGKDGETTYIIKNNGNKK